MLFSVITFCVSLFGIILLLGIRAFELKTNKKIITDSFKKRADSFVHKMTDKVVSGTQHLLLLAVRFIGGITGEIYRRLKKNMAKIEKRVSKIYKYVRGHMELSRKRRASDYIESMKKYKDESRTR